MPRTARVILPGVAHHITQRGNNQQIVFNETADYRHYCHLMNEYAEKAGVCILAYCLMPNHTHVIGIPQHEDSLFKTFHIVGMQYARYLHKKRETSGHIWQGRYYSQPMSDRHLYRAIRYVEQNPIRSGMVRKAWNYPWSSAQFHVKMTKKADILLRNTDFMDKNGWKDYLCEEDEDFKTIKKEKGTCT